jgi:protein-disulfide isomerase
MQSIVRLVLVCNLFFFNVEARADVPETPLHAEQLLNQTPPFPFQNILGNTEAAACTVVVYTSLSCDACAALHKDMGRLLKQYPRLRVMLRDYPTDGPSLIASLVCWCRPEKSESLRKAFYENQDAWVHLPDPRETLKRIAQANGVTKEAIETCLANKSYLTQLMELKLREKALTKLEAVPLVFVIGPPQASGQPPSIERIEQADFKAIEAAVAKYFP